ncbi:MAG TPA: GNAT family N-acetyltransferase [Desulfosporosinus sp.]|nr:GNAT family N-acetyltransferase [Desulfosporosinus sp.]
MLVRFGDVRDWPFIHDLGKLGIADSISPWRKQPIEETLKYREGILKGFWSWIQNSGSTVFIAEASVEESECGLKTGRKRSIGYLILHTSAKEELTGLSQGWIMDFAVLPEWRGKGAGKELLKAAEDLCYTLSIPYLGLAVSSHNVGALHLYEHFGFAEERKLMVKRLDKNNI